MTDQSYAPVIYLRDLDGTGSLHLCDKGDEGALVYVPAKSAEDVGDAVIWPTDQPVPLDYTKI